MSFDTIIKAVTSGFSQFNIKDIIDILLVALLIYQLIRITRNTRAFQVIRGTGMVFILAAISQIIGFTVLAWLLDAIIKAGVVVLVVLFQPELRRGLEQIGRGKIFDRNSSLLDSATPDVIRIVSELSAAVSNLSKRRVGALMVFEQKTGLADIIATGTRINGKISGALVENIFEPNTPLHDGAMILRGDSIVAAGCFLPLSDDTSIARELGTRHRAALGVSMVSDSVTIIVSEETGTVSMAKEGKLIRYLDAKAIRDFLESVYVNKQGSNTLLGLFRRRNKKNL